MATTSHKVKNAVQDYESSFDEFADEAKDTAKNAVANIREGAEKAGEQASSVAATATEKVKDAACFVGDKAEQATGAVGHGMESLGGALRTHLPQQGALTNAGEAVADKLEGVGHYLEDHGLKGMGEDVTNLIRKNPIPALLIGVGVGFLLARMVRR